MNSRNKGKRGELEFVHYLKDRNVEARRGQQYCGTSGDPDVVAGAPLHDCHLEVKRREAGNPYPWLDQAKNDAKPEKIPVVVHKRNGKEWIVILDVDHFLQIMERVYAQPSK